MMKLIVAFRNFANVSKNLDRTSERTQSPLWKVISVTLGNNTCWLSELYEMYTCTEWQNSSLMLRVCGIYCWYWTVKWLTNVPGLEAFSLLV